MLGDQSDMLGRLRAVLPGRWFPDDAPVLDGILQGLAWAWAATYDLLQYVKVQTRIATATDVWLDIIALDFFGSRLARRPGEPDDSLRRRIQLNLFRERGTRAALVAILQELTGRAPDIFEPARSTDTGGYGSSAAPAVCLAYGTSGGWGSLALPFQCFVTAYRPIGAGIATVNGWGGNAAGYGIGPIQYASLAMIAGQVTDTDIHNAIADVMPAASIAWVRIAS